MDKAKVFNTIFLVLSTIGGCIFGAFTVLFFAMFMVTDNFIFFYMAPVGIAAINLFSLPAYRHVLVGIWRYVYNISITFLVTVVCFYGAIEWVESINSARGTLDLRVSFIVGVFLSVLGMVIPLRISLRRRQASL